MINIHFKYKASWLNVHISKRYLHGPYPPRTGTTMRKVLGILGAALATVVSLTVTASPANAADYPSSYYYLSYGASTLEGDTIWYNRSQKFGATMKAVSGCRTAAYGTYTSNGSELDYTERTICNQTQGHGPTLSADVVGGAQFVFIAFGVSNVPSETRYARCDRGDTYCRLVSASARSAATTATDGSELAKQRFIAKYTASASN